MKAEPRYRRYVLAVIGVFAIDVATRMLPLYWTPYSFNPNGSPPTPTMRCQQDVSPGRATAEWAHNSTSPCCC